MVCRCLILLLLSACFAAAQVPVGMVQPPVLGEDMSVSTLILQQWLHSGDPRLIAWAAVFAQRTHDRTVVEEIPAVLDNWMWPSANNYGTGMPQRWAAMAMLDALIRENAAVPVKTIKAVADTMPSQALLLITHLPSRESRRTLSEWAAGTRPAWQGQVLARVAVMLLADNPGGVRLPQLGLDQSLVAFVTAGAEEELVVTLLKPGGVRDGRGGGSAGDMGVGSMPPGWPIVYGYGLAEASARDQRTTLVALGEDRIVWERYASTSSESWSSVEPLDARTRHRLLAFWLSIPAQQMGWQPRVFRNIYWTGKAAYQKQLGSLVDAERTKLRLTVSQLKQRGLLTDLEAGEVMPGLQVTVHCEIKPCPID